MQELKGHGKPLITLLSDQSVTTLIKYADGSFSIVRDDTLLGLWEPNQYEECIEAFTRRLNESRERMLVLPLCYALMASEVPRQLHKSLPN